MDHLNFDFNQWRKKILISSHFLFNIAALKNIVLFLSRNLLMLGKELYSPMIAHFVAEKTSFQINPDSLLCWLLGIRTSETIDFYCLFRAGSLSASRRGRPWCDRRLSEVKV